MTEFSAKVQALNRVVIPATVCEKEGIKQGDIVTLGLFVVKKGK